MSGVKGRSGGARDGSGRKLKYGEEVERVMFQVPKSKVETFKKLVNAILNKWVVKPKKK